MISIDIAPISGPHHVFFDHDHCSLAVRSLLIANQVGRVLIANICDNHVVDGVTAVNDACVGCIC